jgi:trimeric autotransporter adhesin
MSRETLSTASTRLSRPLRGAAALAAAAALALGFAAATAGCSAASGARGRPSVEAAAEPGLTLSASSVTAGEALTATVALDAPARAQSGGVVVRLSFPRVLVAGPTFVRIPNGERSATVTLHTNPFAGAPAKISIFAISSGAGSAFASRALSIAPSSLAGAPRPQVVAVALADGAVAAGAASTGTVSLSAAAPVGGLAVQLASASDALMIDADLPQVVVVPAGATEATFTVRAHAARGGARHTLVASAFGSPFRGAPLAIVAAAP